ncbi:MAG: hypothetical protein A2729_02680 [Candidatus Buchananbacteria bacterium RIFCSPHIGHO2_01_FULL_39_14]|uniref:GIY-YIG domain-containing protein n=1 Tax=Candidatus Buchananbacteria bacterium RIFCSPHIGHO2_01_FULL_39_14 TaxID=1797532 RepID=A0A1G1XS88_9BACT|nr:MAG: hypothetical protein A2729_02680 [Candidatus Buchananbacteria bacterium RIFCSPHIGHO2_01_FULL_39_14]OGY48916.1 MAG: hypothetical protein A3D39_01330 [Candidatus Buchananbacteria bacterium RIFCSPHIGHO2_02_FULL_39_17]
MYNVYVINNPENGKIYIGQTTNKNKGVWQLIYLEKYPNRKTAILREKQLKSYQGRKFIRRLIDMGV